MELHHDCVVGNAVYSFYRKFGVSKVFRMADQGHWDQIPARLERFPREANFVHKYAPRDNTLHRLLRPLHVPCPNGVELHQHSTDVPTVEEIREAQDAKKSIFEDPAVGEMLLNAVRALVHANPSAASKANQFGRTPLHLACIEITSSRAQAAEYLLEHTPMAAREMDCDHYTALHFLLDNPRQDIPTSLLVRYLQSDPDALRRHNRQGLTPFDIYMKGAETKAEKNQRRLDVLAAAKQADMILSDSSLSISAVAA